MLILGLFISSIFFLSTLGTIGVYDFYRNGNTLNIKGKLIVGIFIITTFGIAIGLLEYMRQYYQQDNLAIWEDDEINFIGESHE